MLVKDSGDQDCFKIILLFKEEKNCNFSLFLHIWASKKKKEEEEEFQD